jgi:hypothetical protein
VKGEVKLSSQVLSRYAGKYQAREPKIKGTITVAGGQLMISIGGKGTVPLIGNRRLFPRRFPDGVCKGRQRNHFLLQTLRRFQIRPQRNHEPVMQGSGGRGKRAYRWNQI